MKHFALHSTSFAARWSASTLVASLAVGLAFADGPVDGTMWLGAPGPTADMKYSDGQYWYGYQPAGNGGVATFSATSFCNIAFPSSLPCADSISWRGTRRTRVRSSRVKT